MWSAWYRAATRAAVRRFQPLALASRAHASHPGLPWFTACSRSTSEPDGPLLAQVLPALARQLGAARVHCAGGGLGGAAGAAAERRVAAALKVALASLSVPDALSQLAARQRCGARPRFMAQVPSQQPVCLGTNQLGRPRHVD